jgi:hypothetical protein
MIEKLHEIDNSNNILLQRMISLSSDHTSSHINDPEYTKSMIKMRNSFLITKYH